MISTDMIFWWYTKGWGAVIRSLGARMRDTVDFFSMGSLIRTLFAPFRQISAGGTASEALGERVRAAFDKLFSRIIGAFARIFILIAGVIVLLVELIFSIISIVCWPVLPILPVACIMLAVTGVRF